MDSGYYENLKDQIDKSKVIVQNCVDQPLFRISKGEEYDFSVTSRVDDQIIIVIPFKQKVQLFSISIHSQYGETCPKTVKLYKDEPYISFMNVNQYKPTSTIDVSEETVSKHYTTILKEYDWKKITTLSIFVENSFGKEKTIIDSISLYGKLYN
ncbi:hypothetical protein WA158_000801 [Blastocystis sp. Blastoise]